MCAVTGTADRAVLTDQTSGYAGILVLVAARGLSLPLPHHPFGGYTGPFR